MIRYILHRRSVFLGGKKLPKGPFRTKNAMALETVVFYYTAVVIYYAYWFAADFPKKNSIFRPFAVVNRYDRSV